MKATKVLLSSFVLAGLVSACTNEEFLDVTPDNDALAGRPQVNLTLSTTPSTRMGINDGGLPVFTANDMLGAVLVDKGYSDASSSTVFNNVDWTVVDGHVGNNKWAYNKTNGQFKTEGTTAVGMWLFYTKYNEKMTTTRNGVEFYFPQIQEGAADLKQVENNNINFKITPILAIDGYEGQKLDLTLQYSSVFNYLNLKLDFGELGVTKVQKIVVKAKDGSGFDVKFPIESKVVNSKLPIAKLSLAESAPVAIKTTNLVEPSTTGIDEADQNQEILNAYNEIRVHEISDWGTTASSYASIVASAKPASDVEFLVVDCNSNHENTADDGSMAVVGGKFSTYMLMPSGVYKSITLDIYTDKGVYTETVKGRDAYVANKAVAGAPSEEGGILLRPGKVSVLADIEGHTAKEDDGDFGVSDYLKIAGTAASTNYITKTADLINYINAITEGTATSTVNVVAQEQIGDENKPVDDTPIAAHKVVINQEVMNAIVAKETALGKDLQLTFEGAIMTIIGNESADSKLDIHDLTFNKGCEVISGYVKTSSDIVIPSDQVMTVKTNADVEFACDNTETIDKVVVENGANISAAAGRKATISEIENKGTVTVAGTLDVTTLDNYATIENNNVILVTGGNNYGTINNNGTDADGKITVRGTFKNTTTTITGTSYSGVINNEGLLLVNGTDNPELHNEVGATINNEGNMYCYNGDNKIYNTGTINAKGLNSTTYITANSKVNEVTNVTNVSSGQTLGLLVIENRYQDVSVTTSTQKGYIQYTVKDEDLASSLFEWKNNDKYNLLVLNSTMVILDANLNGKLRYVINNEAANLTLKEGLMLQELTFNTISTLYTTNSDVAKLTIKEGVTVKVPTENKLSVYDVTTGNDSKTTAEFVNNGILLVGGDLYTSIASAEAANDSGARKGIFASGDGASTAFHWNTSR